MAMGSVRFWPTGFVFLVSLAALFLVYFHLESQIANLHQARHRLETAWAQSKVNIEISGGAGGSGGGSDSLATRSDLDDVLEDQPMDDAILVYNRVPKTGSTSLMGLAYELYAANKYHVLHVNISKNNHLMSVPDQRRFVYNSTLWDERKPALYHGHFAFVDFSRFGAKQKPIYINVLREPLDRMVSYYYFLRYGDNFRPHVMRKKNGDTMTFDECVANDGLDCTPEEMWLQIPFFCGHASDCWTPGNAWALEQAKHNLVQHYLLVGITEELQDFVAVLEATLPRFFKGAIDLFATGKKSHLRRTTNKHQPTPATVSKIQSSTVWKMEHEFYEFALEQFHFVRKRTLTVKNGIPSDQGQKFMYEKIRPK